ncbi:MAG TPA: Mur ligase family protein, partial [Nitrosospira sp.]|nr:Mur ligase family protein [Nitrosospira sp.]
GYGAQSQRIWTAETDRTPAIAESISRDKDLTKELLRSCGIPVPEGRPVTSPEDAWRAAEEIGMPVVVKPCDGNHGRGVFIELTSREEVESAYAVALAEGSGVLVERYVPGTEHRLLVVGSGLVAASRGDSVSVIGDGKSTIRELIRDQINSDPRRGSTEDHPLNLVGMDGATIMEIGRQGFGVDSVPPAGLEVLIQRNGNHAFDVTDKVHPSIAAAASLAARVVGLDIAGIDLVARNISRPLAEQEGAIVEVNAGPGLLMHIKPAVGTPRPVGEAIIEHLFPDSRQSRIPVVGISGSCGKTALAHLIARLLRISGRHTGLACSDGLYLDERLVHKGDQAKWQAARNILMNRSVEAAVLENGVEGILQEGLAYDGCHVGILANLDLERHLGYFGIETSEQVFDVLRTQVDVVLPEGAAILNACEPMFVKMAELCNGEVIYFSIDPDLSVIREHRLKGTQGVGTVCGKRAVILHSDEILLVDGPHEQRLARLSELSFSNPEDDVEQIENILAAVASVWALDMEPALVRTGIENFRGSRQILPNRPTGMAI